MGKVLFGAILTVTTFMLVESLTCNKCSFGLLGLCMNSGKETCSTNTSLCFTGKATFPSVQTFPGFTVQGCTEPQGCDMTTNGTLLGVTYQVTTQCCSTDRCNPVQLSGATANRMTLAAAVGAAALTSLWGNMLH